MTRKEALEYINNMWMSGETHDALEVLIPEFGESEEERIRKALIDGVSQIRCKGEITREQMIAYLEKQEIFSKNGEGCYYYHADGSYTFIGSMGFGPIEDIKLNGERPKTENKGVNLPGACLCVEKQKENPKSADSIPSDCTSDANYEDRWHKVGDSLPDNGREVLAKDKLGNTLLARYDGEGWDVSVYDDEDYRCHNGISKWCEIPSEKQKERGPLTKEEEYILHRIIEYLEDETCPSEWISLLHDIYCLPYEKQKEPQNKSMAHEDSSWSGILTPPLCKDKNLDDIAQEYVEGVKKYNPTPDWNLIHTAVCYGYHLAEQKEQKPKEQCVDVIKMSTLLAADRLASAEMTGRLKERKEILENPEKYGLCKPAECEDCAMYLSGNCIHPNGKCENVKSKQEWSEENKRKLNRIYEILGQAADEKPFGSSKRIIGDKEAVELQDFIKLLRPSWKPSEEQMDRLFSIVAALRKDYCDDMADFLANLYADLEKLGVKKNEKI